MTIIKNGTIVTADLTYKADIRIEGGVIAEIGQNLSGGETLDATGCYVMPGGIDPHTHVPDVTGRPLAISSGEVIHGVIA